MSWRHYHVFTAQPDFTRPPQSGIVDDRQTVQRGTRDAWMAWPDQTDRLFNFDFQTFQQAEWRAIREFCDHHGGRSKAFYLPTWTQDFTLAATASAGATQIIIAGHWHTDNLTANRPDTLGRRIFTVSHLGAFEPHWVMEAEPAGDNDLLTLADPIQNAIEHDRTMVGFCHLARLTEDTIQTEHRSTDHVTFSLGFRTVTHRRRLDQSETLTGAAVGTMKPAFDVLVTDADPAYPETRHAAAMGPINYGISQTDPFVIEYTVDLDPATNTASLLGFPGGPIALAIYNAAEPADQIGFMFDGTSREILTWSQDDQTTIRWRAGASISTVQFTGRTPVAFNTFSIDGTATPGTATTAVFYLKPSDPAIYCRVGSESYGTEHRYCQSTIAPLSLQAATRNEGRLEIIGMDANHRLARWRSDPYQTPPEIQLVTATHSETITGEHRAIYVLASKEESCFANHSETITGELRELRVVGDPPDEGATATHSTTLTGSLVAVTIVGDPPDEAATCTHSTTATGAYTEKAIMPDALDESALANHSTTLTGTYAP